MLALLPLRGSSVCLSIIMLNSRCAEYLVRFPLRHESRRVLHWDIYPGRLFRHHRLDDPSLVVTNAILSVTKSRISPVSAVLCHFSNSLSYSVMRICVP